MAKLRQYLRVARRWAGPGAAIVLALLAAWMLLSSLRQDVWTVYSDPAGETFEQDDPRARPVLWQDPEPELLGDPTPGTNNSTETERVEAAFSSDGATMVLARSAEGRGYDLYSSRWNGRRWSNPEPIAGVNTKGDERSPALSRDGRTLYFASERKGGAGGLDIYTAQRKGRGWGGIKRLPDTVNSPADELDPAPTPDGAALYFASDRDGNGSDILIAQLDSGSRSAAQPVDPLNSEAADLRAALTARGDHVFLSSDRDRRGDVGFKVYLSRVRDGQPASPEEVELYFEGGDVTAPASRMDGFDLLFSARPDTGDDAAGFTLYRSTTREVVSYTDRSRWEQFKKLMGDIAWWILLAIAALIALIYILEKWRDITSLFHKCLAGSGILHLLALLAAMAWLIAREVERDDGENFEEIEVSIDALAQEELALESIPDQTVMETPATDMESEKVESEFGATGFEAQDAPAAMPTRIETQRESVVAEATPAAAEADTPLPDPVDPASVLGALAAAALPEIDAPTLEEREPTEPVEQVDPAESTFDPATPAPAEVAKAEPAEAADTAMADVAPAETVTDSAPTQPLSEQSRESVVEAATPEALDAPPMEIPALEPMTLDALPELAFEARQATPLEEPAPNEGETAEPSESDTFDPSAAVPALVAIQADTGFASASAGEAATEPSMDTGAVATTETLTTGGTTAPEIGGAPAAEAASPGEVAMPSADAPAMGSLPELAIGDLVGEPSLEEAPANDSGGPADTSGDQFQPDASAAARIAMAPAASGTPNDQADTSETGGQSLSAAEIAAAGAPTVETRPPEAVTTTAGLPSLPAAPLGLASLPVAIPVALETPALDEGAPAAPATPANTEGERFDPSGTASSLATSKSSSTAVPDTTATGQSDATAVAKSTTPMSGSGAVQARPPEAATTGATGAVPPLAPTVAVSPLPDLAPSSLGDLALEEPTMPGGGAADPSADQFKPGAVAADLSTNPATNTSAIADSATGSGQASPDALAETQTTASSNAVVAAAAAASLSADPLAPSPITSPTLGTPAPANIALPPTLDAPASLDMRGLAQEVGKIRGKPSLDAIEQMGGSEGTEGAIGAAIEWLVRNQQPDGRWDTRAHGAKQNYDSGGVGLALLCFYGWGERHDRECKYRDAVRRALEWLLAAQDDKGYLGGRPGMMYSHAIASIALCEAYGLTKDARLREPAERSIAYTLAAQSKSKGGWRYSPGEDSDTSVTGWQFMALHSARMAGLTVPEENFERARAFLDQMGGGRHGGLYGYQERGKLSRAMVATGMFCRQLDLIPPGDPKQAESARVLKMHPIKVTKPDLYYVYYATLALYQHQGPIWQSWNARLKEALRLIQEKNGDNAGSWNPSASMAGDGGRVISTALSTLSLEVYYRLLPMYGFRNTEAEPPPAETRE